MGEVFEKLIKGLRHEMGGVIGDLERNRSLSLEDLKGLLKHSLEAVIGSVELFMSGISDEMARDRKRRDGDERKRDERAQGKEQRDTREKKKRDMEGKKWEERMHRTEEKEKAREDRLTAMEEQVEKDRSEKAKEGRRIEERLEKMEEQMKKERSEKAKEGRRIEERLEKIEERFEQERKERERIEKCVSEMEGNEKEYREEEAERTTWRQKVVLAKESEKEMEGRVGEAMEEIKILDMDFGKVLDKKGEIVKEAMEMIKEKVKLQDRKDWEWSVRRSKIYVLGQQTREKEYEGRKIFTVPILLRCSSIGDKETMERLLRNSGIRVSIHWPKEMLGYVKGIRERVEGMGHGGMEEFVRVRPVKQDGALFIRADVRRKDGGRFKLVADWKCPAVNKDYWSLADDIMKPYWVARDERSMS